MRELSLYKIAKEARDLVSQQMDAQQIGQAERRAAAFRAAKPSPELACETTEEIRFRDAAGWYEITIHRIVLGRRGVDEGVVYDHQVDQAEAQQKRLLYFDVTVLNLKDRSEAHIDGL